MQNYNPNQLTAKNSSTNNDIVQKASQLKQNEVQQYYDGVKQYVQSTQNNQYGNSIEQNAKQLKQQSAKNYIQQMNGQLTMQ